MYRLAGIALLVLLTVSVLSATPKAAQKALTDTGEEVILNDDGTWRYSSDVLNASKKITLNENKFVKSPDASFELKSNRNNAVFWVNPNEWTIKKGEGDQEYVFGLKGGGDLYALSISEGIAVDPVVLSDIAFENAKGAGLDNANIVQREYENRKRKQGCLHADVWHFNGRGSDVSWILSDEFDGGYSILGIYRHEFSQKYLFKMEELLNGLATGHLEEWPVGPANRR